MNLFSMIQMQNGESCRVSFQPNKKEEMQTSASLRQGENTLNTQNIPRTCIPLAGHRHGACWIPVRNTFHTGIHRAPYRCGRKALQIAAERPMRGLHRNRPLPTGSVRRTTVRPARATAIDARATRGRRSPPSASVCG